MEVQTTTDRKHDWRVSGAASNVNAVIVHWRCATCGQTLTAGIALGFKLPSEPDGKGCRGPRC
jgi:hypothetical protein